MQTTEIGRLKKMVQSLGLHDHQKDFTGFLSLGIPKNVVHADEPTTRENMIERIRVACRAIGT